MTATLEPDALVSDARAKRNVMVLVAAQAILGAQMPMLFVVGGLAGGMLAWHVCFATLPIALIVFGGLGLYLVVIGSARLSRVVRALTLSQE